MGDTEKNLEAQVDGLLHDGLSHVSSNAVANDDSLLHWMRNSRLGAPHRWIDDIGEVYGTVLLGDVALCVADVTPRKRFTVDVEDVGRHIMWRPRWLVGFSISEANKNWTWPSPKRPHTAKPVFDDLETPDAPSSQGHALIIR